MKRLLIILPLLLMLALSATATRRAILLSKPLTAGGGGSGDPCTGCTNETFEGTGTVVAGYIYGGGGITNVDYATSPAPLVGSQSFLIRNDAFAGSYQEKLMPTATNGAMRFMFNITNTVVNGVRIASFADTGGSVQIQIQVQGGKLRIAHGTATADTVTSVSANTTYYCWLYGQKGTGANGIANVAFSTSKTRPTSGNGFAEVTTGTATLDLAIYSLFVSDLAFSGASSGIIYDEVSRKTGTAIGDYP